MAIASGYRTYLFVFDVDGGRVVCPIAERTAGDRADIVTPYGFSGPTANVEYPQFSEVWRRFAIQQGWVCGYLLLHPALEQPTLYQESDACRRTEVYMLDLRPSESELYAGLSRNRRRELKAWTARGDRQTTDRAAITDFVVHEQARFFSSRGASATYRFPEAMWRSLLMCQNVIVLGATMGSRIVAASIFGHTETGGESLFNVSLPEGRQFSTALLWEGALLLKQRGVPILHLGGGVRAGDGVAEFKQRFRPQAARVTSLCQIYDQDAYARLCRQIDADPDDRSGYFPPYRRAWDLSDHVGADGTSRSHVR